MANYILLVLFGISNTLYADQDVGGGNSTGRRHRRGLYGSEVTGGLCPSECLCLSEIQVQGVPYHWAHFFFCYFLGF